MIGMDEKLDLNQADKEQLAQLPGIGAARAAKIIEYRSTVHPFEEVIELAAVPGISERMVRIFEDRVTVGEVVTEDEAVVLPAALADGSEPDNIETVREPESGAETSALVVSDTAVVPADTAPSSALDRPDAGDEAAVDADTTVVEGEITPRQPPDTEMERARESTPPAMTFVETEPSEQESTADESRVAEQPQQEQQMNEEPVAPAVPSRPSESDTVSRQRGCLFIIIGAVAGAILGTTLTLALLYALNNNSLEYANQQVESQLLQTESDLERLNGTLEAVRGDVGDISTQADTFAEEQTSLSTTLDDVSTSVDALETDLGTVEDEIDALEETTVDLDERLDMVASSAETFDAFLEGMRVLLNELEGGEAAVSPGATVTTTVTITPTESVVTPTPTPIPTRTPRPTATPIVLPTPEQQP